MPLIRVEMTEGKSKEYKKTVLDCIHDSLLDTLNIEDWDRFQRIVEIKKDDFEKPKGKSDDFMIIEVTMFKGRSKDQKRALIEGITAMLNKRLQIAPTDVFIVIHEPPDENWGLAGKQRG